jgi:hypothetical protein
MGLTMVYESRIYLKPVIGYFRFETGTLTSNAFFPET